MKNSRIQGEKVFHEEHFGDGGRRNLSDRFYTDVSQQYILKNVICEAENIIIKNVLIIGVGVQTDIIKYFINRGSNVAAIDISRNCLISVRKNFANEHLILINADAHNLPFADDSMDFVYGKAILHHLDLNKSLHDIKRVMKSKGKGIFIEPMGTNKLINMYRNITKKERTEDEKPLNGNDLLTIKRIFPYVDVKYISISSTIHNALHAINKYVAPKALFHILTMLDEKILSRWNWTRKYAWTCIIKIGGQI